MSQGNLIRKKSLSSLSMNVSSGSRKRSREFGRSQNLLTDVEISDHQLSKEIPQMTSTLGDAEDLLQNKQNLPRGKFQTKTNTFEENCTIS